MDKIKNKLILHYIMLQLTYLIREEKFNANIENVASLKFSRVHLVSVLRALSKTMAD